MDLLDRLTSSISNLSTDPTSIDVSSILSLLKDTRETITGSASGAQGEAGLSQPGAALSEKMTELTSRNEVLEKTVSSFNGLFSHLKDLVAGKIEVIYKNSTFKSQMLSDIRDNNLSIENFIKLQNQIDHQFNNAWFPDQTPVQFDKNSVSKPQNYKSGGNKWVSPA